MVIIALRSTCTGSFVLVLVVVLTACGPTDVVAVDEPSVSPAVATRTTSTSAPTQEPDPEPELEPDRVLRSNEASYGRATDVLRAAGVSQIGEWEPAHGSLSSSVGGRFRGDSVVAGVGPDVVPQAGPSVDVCGTSVVAVGAERLQFRLGPDGWSVSVYAGDSFEVKRRATRTLVEAILC